GPRRCQPVPEPAFQRSRAHRARAAPGRSTGSQRRSRVTAPRNRKPGAQCHRRHAPRGSSYLSNGGEPQVGGARDFRHRHRPDAGRMRAAFYAVLHHSPARYWTGAGHSAIGGERSQREDQREEPEERGHNIHSANTFGFSFFRKNCSRRLPSEVPNAEGGGIPIIKRTLSLMARVPIRPKRLFQRCYYVYILSSLTGTLYTGLTDDLKKRMMQHKAGTFDGFTKKYKINRLMYFECFSDPRA